MRALVGILVLLGIAVMLSKNRRAIRPRTVAGAFGIQAFIAWLVLYNEAGRNALNALAGFVNAVIAYGSEGIGFLFGPLVDVQATGFVFAFKVLPVIIFFSSLISLLYYLGVMQWVVRIMGGVLAWALGTSQAESLSATANIFVGQTEAPLVVKPFIKDMTESELFAIMVGGLASVAGSVLAGYAGLGVELKYLLAASFMAAPGGLLMAKLMVPETETPKTKGSLTGRRLGCLRGGRRGVGGSQHPESGLAAALRRARGDARRRRRGRGLLRRSAARAPRRRPRCHE